MTNYSVKEEQSRLWIDADSRQLRLRVSSISLDFAFDFKLWSDPEWIKDKGTGTISVFDCDISLGVKLNRNEEDGTLEVSIEPEDDEEQDDIPALDVELESDVLLEEELPRLEDTLLLLQMSTILQTSTCLQPVLVLVVVVVSGVVLAVVSSALVVKAASVV